MERLEEVKRVISEATDTEKLDIIHYLRIKYSRILFEKSRSAYKMLKPKMQNIPDFGGVYFIIIVDPEKNVILYPGQTSGSSKTSGLRFRLQDHIRFLGKTPLTLFIPSWWVKRLYPIPLKDRKKATKLEKSLWQFVKENSNISRFKSIQDLEEKILPIVRKYIPNKTKLEFVELQEDLHHAENFIIKEPPAGSPSKGYRRAKNQAVLNIIS